MSFTQWLLDGRDDLLQAMVALPDSIRPTGTPGSVGIPTQMENNLENGTYEQWMASKQPEIALLIPSVNLAWGVRSP